MASAAFGIAHVVDAVVNTAQSASAQAGKAEVGQDFRPAMLILLSRGLPPFDLGTEALLLGTKLGREFLTEILGREDGANLDVRLFARHGIRTALDPVQRLVH